MKKYVFTIIVLSLIATFPLTADAQHGDAQHGSLKGPVAKNHRPWKDSHMSTVLVTQPDPLKGPQAKNSTISLESEKMSPVLFLARLDHKGPKAKNEAYEWDSLQLALGRKKLSKILQLSASE